MLTEHQMKPLDFSGNHTGLMGVLNITPDSFSDGGHYLQTQDAVNHALRMISEGADIIDIGGESSRPGATPVTAEEELNRVIPVIQKIREQSPIPISIDTTKSIVAKQALKAGATIVNDISSFSMDPEMSGVVKESLCPVVLMHMQGTPQSMQKNPQYQNVVEDIKNYFKTLTARVINSGISKNKIIIDPGIGFGKTMEHNLEILRRLHEFTELGFPVLIGVSRKSFIGKILDVQVNQRLEGSLSAAVLAVWNGASIIRAHDIKETKRALSIVEAIKKGVE